MYMRGGVKSKVYNVWSTGGAGEEVRHLSLRDEDKAPSEEEQSGWRLPNLGSIAWYTITASISMTTMTTSWLGCYCNSHIRLSPGDKTKLSKVSQPRNDVASIQTQEHSTQKPFVSASVMGSASRQEEETGFTFCLLGISFPGLPFLSTWLDSLRNVFSSRFRDICKYWEM